MSKREMGLRYEPSPQALRAIAEELRAVGVELDSPSIRRALSAALEIEGPRLEQMAREEAEAEIRSLRAAHQDALRILLEASGAEVRAVPPRAQVPVSQAPTLQMPSVPPQPKPAPPDPCRIRRRPPHLRPPRRRSRIPPSRPTPTSPTSSASGSATRRRPSAPRCRGTGTTSRSARSSAAAGGGRRRVRPECKSGQPKRLAR